MYYYLRKMFSNPQNLHQLQRTVSGLDPKLIESGNYLYKNFIKNFNTSAIVDSLRLLNIYGEGTLNRVPNQQYDTPLINMWGGGLWTKTSHPSCQKPSHPFVLSKENNPLRASQKNSSCPQEKSSP